MKSSNNMLSMWKLFKICILFIYILIQKSKKTGTYNRSIVGSQYIFFLSKVVLFHWQYKKPGTPYFKTWATFFHEISTVIFFAYFVFSTADTLRISTSLLNDSLLRSIDYTFTITKHLISIESNAEAMFYGGEHALTEEII